MRETFRAQYNSQFKASSDRTWENTVPTGGVFLKPGASAVDSRAPQELYDEEAEGSSSKKTKRSRWN